MNGSFRKACASLFLSLFPRAEKVYEDNEDAINKENLSEEEAIVLFKKYAPKLEKRNQVSKSKAVKEEPTGTVFMAEESNKPGWAQEMIDMVRDMTESVMSVMDSEEESCDSEAEKTLYANKPQYQTRPSSKKKVVICKSCSKMGHIEEDCYIKCVVIENM